MRKVLILLVFLTVPFLACSQDVISYGDKTVVWNYDRVDSDGIPIPEDVEITFEVVAYKITDGESGLFSLGTSSITRFDVDLTPYTRAVYIIGVRAVYLDKQSEYAWSNNINDVESDTFGLVPGDVDAFILTKPKTIGVE